jgi:hypothetical protein
MKLLILLLLPAALLAQGRWITICHYSNAGGSRTLRIVEAAWENHRDNHGDTRGACSEAPTLDPDIPVDPTTNIPLTLDRGFEPTDLDTPTLCRLFPLITPYSQSFLYFTNVGRDPGFARVEIRGQGLDLRLGTRIFSPADRSIVRIDPTATYVKAISYNADIRPVLEVLPLDGGVSREYGQACRLPL